MTKSTKKKAKNGTATTTPATKCVEFSFTAVETYRSLVEVPADVTDEDLRCLAHRIRERFICEADDDAAEIVDYDIEDRPDATDSYGKFVRKGDWFEFLPNEPQDQRDD